MSVTKAKTGWLGPAPTGGPRGLRGAGEARRSHSSSASASRAVDASVRRRSARAGPADGHPRRRARDSPKLATPTTAAAMAATTKPPAKMELMKFWREGVTAASATRGLAIRAPVPATTPPTSFSTRGLRERREREDNRALHRGARHRTAAPGRNALPEQILGEGPARPGSRAREGGRWIPWQSSGRRRFR